MQIGDTEFKLQVVKMHQGSACEKILVIAMGETAVRRWLAQFEAELQGRAGSASR
jgi:hypothetical protein